MLTPNLQLPHQPIEVTRAVDEIEVPRQLKSPNAWNGRHWRYKHRESQEWEKAIFYALAQQRGVRGVVGALLVLGAFPWQASTEKRTVTVTRIVPSKRNFIRDEDNLRFSVKPLNDALKRLGLIRDDSRKWLEQDTPTQEVSPSGQWVTRIRIERTESPPAVAAVAGQVE